VVVVFDGALDVSATVVDEVDEIVLVAGSEFLLRPSRSEHLAPRTHDRVNAQGGAHVHGAVNDHDQVNVNVNVNVDVNLEGISDPHSGT
jgi:hypothetical protein